MTETRATEQLFVAALEIEGRRYAVSIETAFDGVEHIGHLCFVNEDWEEDEGIADRVGITGRTANDILLAARALSSSELQQRYDRALGTTRRFHGLRKATDDVLENIRHLAKVSTSMRAGLLDVDDAAREIDATEQRLVAMVRQLKGFAGVSG
ncbi:MAG: hypothetical protein ACT4P6_10070 [Gemmatimonadaceae bacterium]